MKGDNNGREYLTLISFVDIALKSFKNNILGSSFGIMFNISQASPPIVYYNSLSAQHRPASSFWRNLQNGIIFRILEN